MQVVLEPLSLPELGEIVIRDSLFAIGRFEAPFESFQSVIVAKLSRRHARIFKESGEFYVVDLGSTNGTKLNDREVQENPAKLHSGDKLCFAELIFKVSIKDNEDSDTILEPDFPSIHLALEPIHNNSVLQPILITKFPFLIGKINEAFSGYEQSYPDEVNYLSRRHALIFQKQAVFYIEDLGSTNGTFVSGKRLDEHAIPIRDGETIALGGDYFVYKVGLQKQEIPGGDTDSTKYPSPLADGPEVIRDRTNTTFITTATSFLDIFCIRDKGEDGEERALEVNQRGASADKIKDGGIVESRTTFSSPGLSHRVRLFFDQIKETSKKKYKPSSIRPVWMVLAALGLVISVCVGVYLKNDKEREIRTLLTAGKFDQSAALSNQYLREYADNKVVMGLGEEALMKSIGPTWITAVTANNFKQAELLLDAARQRNQFNQNSLKLLEAMGWVGNLEKFIVDQAGAHAPIKLYYHESTITSLLEWWETENYKRHQLLGKILGYVPSFRDLYTRAISHIRKLRTYQSLYIKAIGELNDTIQKKLDSGQAQDLASVFTRFEHRYPNVRGIHQLKNDLEKYLVLEQAEREKNLEKIRQLRSELEFQTQPFREHVAQRPSDALSP